MKTKEKVQAAIVDRLATHSGLDLKSIDVSTTSLTFDKNMAYATVAFHSKGDPDLRSGMIMKYTLEARDGKWVVTKVGDSSGHAAGNGQGENLPPGHVPIDQGANAANPHAAAPTQ